MPKCSAFGCNYTTKSKKSEQNPNISLHNVPKEKLRERWIKAARCIRLSKDLRLCSQNFLPDDFEISVLLQKKLLGHSRWKRKLKDNAVPTIFAFTPVKKPRLQSEQRAERRQRQEVNISKFLKLLYFEYTLFLIRTRTIWLSLRMFLF